jgi:hypothetical protein
MAPTRRNKVRITKESIIANEVQMKRRMTIAVAFAVWTGLVIISTVAPLRAADNDCDPDAATMLTVSSSARPLEFYGRDIGQSAINELWRITTATNDYFAVLGKTIAADQDWFGACKYPGLGIVTGSGWGQWQLKNVTLWVWADEVDISAARDSVVALVTPVPLPETPEETTTTTTSTTTSTTTTTTTTTVPATTTTTTTEPEPEPEPTTTTSTTEPADTLLETTTTVEEVVETSVPETTSSVPPLLDTPTTVLEDDAGPLEPIQLAVMPSDFLITAYNYTLSTSSVSEDVKALSLTSQPVRVGVKVMTTKKITIVKSKKKASVNAKCRRRVC